MAAAARTARPVSLLALACLIAPGSAAGQPSGTVVGWGWNIAGQLDVPGPNSGFVAVAAESLHSLGLRADGSVAGWGLNDQGQTSVPPPNSGYSAIAASGPTAPSTATNPGTALA